jgi:chemotaxis protein CheC
VESFEHFAEQQLDVLREVGNIGAGNAATALSKLMNNPVEMKVPRASVLQFDEITEILGGAERVVAAIFMRVSGETPGNMFFMIDTEQAKQMVRHIAGIDLAGGEDFSPMERSALAEIGNILIGSYLSALADFTKLHLTPSVPSLAVDMAGAILSFGLTPFGPLGDHALLIDTSFFVGTRQLEGYFFFLPDPESFGKLFQALGVPY